MNVAFRPFPVAVLGGCLALLLGAPAHATVLSWTFDGGDLSIQGASGGTGSLAYKDAGTQGSTTFGSTGVFPPDPAGGVAKYLRHSVLPNGGDAGYQLSFLSNVPPNGGGAYVNRYTMIFDVFVPQLNWTPLFNAEPTNCCGNDADWYVAPDGALGIGVLGYSPAGTVSANSWNRLGFVADLPAGVVKYFVNGALVFTRTGGALTDGRFSLYSSNDVAPHVNLHGEGDTSGNYTNEVFWNNFLFADYGFSDSAMQSLGGATAGPIPEPSTWMLATLGLVAIAGLRRRRR